MKRNPAADDSLLNQAQSKKKGDALIGEKLSEEKIKWSQAVAEADVHMRNFDYSKADEFYSKAIAIDASNLHVLNCRSMVRNLLGEAKKSEQDADAILAIDPKSQAGHMCKANALYTLGEFEMAMVWFIRGQKVPMADLDQLQVFRLGEGQCRIAIEKAIETFDVPKLRLILERKKSMHDNPLDKSFGHPTGHASVYTTKKQSKVPLRLPLTGQSLTIAQNLLEELFDDYAFLRELEVSPSIHDPLIASYIGGSLDYLEGRIEFWRARNPKAVHDTSVVDAIVKSGKPIARVAKYLKESARVLDFSKNVAILPKIGEKRDFM